MTVPDFSRVGESPNSVSNLRAHRISDASSGERRPSLGDIGVNALAKRLVVVQVTVAVILLALLPRVGLTIAWSSGLPFFCGDLVLVGVWIYFWRVPGRSAEWIIPETLAALVLMLTFTHILSPAQYVAVAFKRPLIDPFLASADRFLGLDVSALANWSRDHPRLNFGMAAAYYSFIPQLAALVAVLGIVIRDREALWEYVFHFYFCSTVTVICLAVFPAACAFQYLQFESTLNQTRFIAHFNGLRAGTFTVVRLTDMEGLISMPSLHVAGAFMVVWALRRHRKALFAAAPVNLVLIAATVMTGAHYVVDLAGTLAMFGLSLTLWQVYGRPLLGSSTAGG